MLHLPTGSYALTCAHSVPSHKASNAKRKLEPQCHRPLTSLVHVQAFCFPDVVLQTLPQCYLYFLFPMDNSVSHGFWLKLGGSS